MNPILVKDKSKTKRNEPQSQKGEVKRFSKKGFESIKTTQQNMKTASMKKTSSTCSVKKYYIMQKAKL